MFKPEGVYVAMLTPFKEDGSVNNGELRRIIDFQIEGGVHGLFPISSVGEFIHMSRDEKVRMMEIIVDQNKGRVKITPGVGSSLPAESIFLAQKAKELGCDGVVVAPPYFYQLSQENIETYFETIADAVDIPNILYNIPLFTQPLSYDVVKRLSRHPNVVGMKDSSGSMVDFMHFMDKIKIAGEDINVLTGREETLFACLMVGGKGCMTATAGILPEIMVDLYTAWKQQNYEQAKVLQESILLILRTMFSLPFPLGFKLGMEMRGFKMGPPKQPLSDAERFNYRNTKVRIEKIMLSILGRLKKDQKATA
ncbi:MAG: dihydrodipicolinate synthase family protein [Deltaproteobacteria bacterium]|jgi:N-acetylneuraminate lyase/4-hydroxy-tetrahydrodipicolinate synthase|nr:dihydrodipicolinate synthase family protein [Deltaproteobacteria bacterium]